LQKDGRILINATGVDTVKLWFFRYGKIEYEHHRNHTWIFVTGTDFDIDFLESQLDLVSDIHLERSIMHDIYGQRKGLKIHLRPSRIRDMIHAVNTIGFGRKFQMYNSDIDPILRYISTNDLEFFSIDNLRDLEPEIQSIKVVPLIHGNRVDGFTLNGTRYPLNHDSLSTLRNQMGESHIIICSNEHGGFRKILEAGSTYGIAFPPYRETPGRAYVSYNHVMYSEPSLKIWEKICIPITSFIYSEAGMYGVYQVSRISSLPPETVAKITPGTAVSALEISHALKNNILIPHHKRDYEGEKSIGELFELDRGGLVLQPAPGIYENVYELDFSSMYPSIIVRYNLSPETLSKVHGKKIPGTPYFVLTERRGFLPKSLSELLGMRLFYKHIRAEHPAYEARNIALKWLLLTSFGYTGYKNAKFGKIEIHEAITSTGRWALSKSIKMAQDRGFRVIHGIVDSLWLQGDGDVASLVRDIEKETSLEITVEGHYRWVIFFPTMDGLGATNRYVGLKDDRTYKVRGIELRRSDIPPIAKRFQIEALELLKTCNTSEEILRKKMDIERLKDRYLKKLLRPDPEDLYVKLKVSKRLSDYRVNNLQRRTLLEFSRKGVELQPGQSVSVVVKPEGMEKITDDHDDGFNKEYYRRILRRAFKMFDFIFSLDRTVKDLSSYDQELPQPSSQEP